MAEDIVYDITAPGLDKITSDLAVMEAAAKKSEAAIDAMNARLKSLMEAATKAGVSARALSQSRAAADEVAAKAAQKEADAAKARLAAAERAEMAASKMAAEGSRAYQTLLKVGGEYGQMLRDGIDATSELAKTWKAGLSPAEKTALNLVKVAASTDSLTASQTSLSLSVANASEKLADQIRRQDTNVGSQNKLSRSLSELLQQQTDAILKGQQMAGTLSAQGVAQAKAAESAKDLTLVLKQLEFDTADADKESEQYKSTVAALQQRIKGLALEEEKAAHESKKSADAYGKQKQQLDSLETAMDALSIPGAGLVVRFKQVSDSLETMAEHGSKSQAMLLRAGIAVGSVGAAAAAAVAGVAAVGAAIVGVTAKAADWNEELRKTGMEVKDGNLERYAASVSSVGTVLQAMGVQIASFFGPAVEGAATRVAALGLAGIDAWKNLSKGQDVMTLLARTAATVLVEAFTLPITAIQKLSESFNEPLTMLSHMPGQIGVTAQALKAMAWSANLVDDQISAWKTDQIDAVEASIKMLTRDGMAPLIAASDDYMGKAGELVKKQAALNVASRESTQAVKEHAKAMRELAEKSGSAYQDRLQAIKDSLMTPLEQATAAYEDRVRELNAAYMEGVITQEQYARGMTDARGAMDAAQSSATGFKQALSEIPQVSDAALQASVDLGKSAAAAHDAAAQRARDSWSGSFSGIADIAGKVSDMMIAHSKRQGDAAERAAIQAFRVQQAASSASVVLSTSQAVMQALGTLPPPASYVAAGVAAAAGVAQLATIWAQPPPSSAGGGGGSITSPSFNSASSAGATTSKPTQQQPRAQSPSMVEPVSPVSYVEPVQPVMVTDAYIPPSSSAQYLKTTPGDEVTVERSGARKERDSAMMATFDAMVSELKGLRADVQQMTRQMLYGQHSASVRPAGA